MSAVRELALRAKEASRRLAVLSTDEKNALLLAMADELTARKKEILEANRKDVEAGRVAGCRTIFLDYGYSEKRPKKPDFKCKNLQQAADWILEKEIKK